MTRLAEGYMLGRPLQALEGRVPTAHRFASAPAPEVRLNLNGGLDLNRGNYAKRRREVMFNSVMTFEQIDAMFLDIAVAKRAANSAPQPPMLGVMRRQLAYSLKRLREGAQLNPQTLTR